ncbi:phosphoenolpyruvate--protein phosphotransferase [Kocuria coralli]|uniref:Phosphoenolpyruvate-protein phosphotransferase n=1 Tax=Kocuria coralli TaxID=1461025 RepID=A0A5J5KZE3_9MICC|nr:phosphoenolpyruvate--protein phosphotransferase [Kocuria coralli]KAA9394216.1 phosphoenolpyruvate--protein phosphotransferase [Kocuria coralli]
MSVDARFNPANPSGGPADSKKEVLQGIGVVAGIAASHALWARPRPQLPTDGPEVPEAERDEHKERFDTAAATVAGRLRGRSERAIGHAAEVLEATAALVTDRGWRRAVAKQIDSGATAVVATVRATEAFVAKFEKVGGLMAERTTDLKDIRDRVVAELRGEPEPGVPSPDEPVILLAEDLAPADTAGLDPDFVRGIATQLGGKTSHTAIIARQFGIPCVVGVGWALSDVQDGSLILIDGEAGEIETAPDPLKAEARAKESAEMQAKIRSWTGPAVTADGTAVQLLANVQDGAGARAAAATGLPEGVGLFRTELCFLSAQSEPSVETQAGIYREVFEAFPQQKVVVRTLDAGSDKPLAFATMPDEPNPSLGVRGVRIAFDEPGVLERQLDAVAEAASGTGAEPWVMAPMIATVDEAEWYGKLCRDRGLIPGVMIEVPSAALLGDELLKHVEFFSIGTNDLTQYAMAADRMASQLSELTDPWQPAVLKLIKMAADAGQRADKPVGVCGEAAADPLLACVLVGLGVTSLSAAAPALAAVGVQLGQTTDEQIERAAQAAVSAPTAQAAQDAAFDIIKGGK